MRMARALTEENKTGNQGVIKFQVHIFSGIMAKMDNPLTRRKMQKKKIWSKLARHLN